MIKNGAVMLQNTVAKKCTYALKNHTLTTRLNLENQSGLLLKVNGNEVWVN
jgi:UDP-N-acetylmuramoyl-L-alanyl-D-glutamate--2,6-diaminopimelate ligase